MVTGFATVGLGLSVAAIANHLARNKLALSVADFARGLPVNARQLHRAICIALLAIINDAIAACINDGTGFARPAAVDTSFIAVLAAIITCRSDDAGWA